FLEAARKRLTEVKEHLREAHQLAESQNLALLRENGQKAEAKVQQYEEMVGQAVAVTEALDHDAATMDKAAREYMGACVQFVNTQSQMLTAVLGNMGQGSNTAVAEVEDHIKKIGLANDIVDLGNTIRIGNWKSQAKRDPTLFQETQKKFA